MKLFYRVLGMLFLLPAGLYAQQDETLSPGDFQKTLLKENVQLIDVRTSGEYQQGHLKNALQADWNNPDEFKDRVQYLDKNKPVLIYCAVGGRSHAAAEWLRNNSFADVRELKGGITAWKLDNKPVEDVKPVSHMTMDDYNRLLKSHDKVLIDFTASWCPPCKTMEPVLLQLKEDLAGKFQLITIDAGAQTDLLRQLKINMIPAFLIYNNGTETWRRQGVTSLSTLKKKLGS